MDVAHTKQPTRSKRVTKERRFDKTQLRLGGHGRVCHRDYFAHYLRWGYVVDQMNAETRTYMGAWLTGLVDGEGCFSLTVRDREGVPNGHYIQFAFSLGLREDDLETINLVQKILGGSISGGQNTRVTNAKPIVILNVSDRSGIRQVVDFFREFPLQSKKARDFEIWSEAFDLFDKERGESSHGVKITDELFEKIKGYKNFLESERSYETWKRKRDWLRDPDYANRVMFPYGWVQRRIKQGLAILDIGCGQDQSLLYVLGSRIQTVPDCYLGVDLNSISKKSHVKWAEVWDNFNFVDNYGKILKEWDPFDVVTCFETVEHMMPPDAEKLLQGAKACLKPKGILYLSTPVFNGQAAANHVHEFEIQELRNLVEKVGFKVLERHGTFASKPDIIRAMDAANDIAGRKIYDELEQFLGGEVISCFMAAKYPDASRNIIWVLEAPEDEDPVV